MKTRILSALALFAAFTAGFAVAQTYPSRAVKIVVATSPGGTTDLLARALARGLSESWGQPVVVENRPGANEIIGVTAVSKSAPDGYTLAFSDCAAYVINPNLHKNLPYDSVRDFTPVITLARPSPVLVANSSLAANSFPDLVALVKSEPNKLSYGSFGNGSYPHISMENLKRLAGVEISHVPFKGSAPALTALLSGQISLMLVNLGNVQSNVKAGKLKLLSAATPKRLLLVPNLPTISESGLPGFQASTWWGMLAPAGTPREIIAKLNGESNKILATPSFAEKYLIGNTLEPVGNTPEEAAELIKTDLVHWATLVKASGAQID